MQMQIIKPIAPQPAPRSRAEGNKVSLWILLSKQLVILLVLGLMIYGFSEFARNHLVQTVQIEGRSMLPTLPDKKLYLLNRAALLFREPQPEEIVVLRDPETNGYAVKRIVAKPGDSVFVEGGKIFVNGVPLNEPYLEPDTRTFPDGRYKAQLWICGVNQYFVLGDNRYNSADSRNYGAVRRQNILGTITP